MSERVGSDIERHWNWIFRLTQNRLKMKISESFYVVISESNSESFYVGSASFKILAKLFRKFHLFLELRCGREGKHNRGRFDQMDEPAWEVFDKITSWLNHQWCWREWWRSDWHWRISYFSHQEINFGYCWRDIQSLDHTNSLKRWRHHDVIMTSFRILSEGMMTSRFKKDVHDVV